MTETDNNIPSSEPSKNKQKGGFLLDLLFGKKEKQPRQTKKQTKTILGASKDSEEKLIKSYEGLATASKKYYEDYNKHLANLITLDDINGMTGLQTTFKNVIVKNLFKGTDKVDQSSPILLRNYSVSENITPKFFRREHLISQVRYKLSGFALKDTILISEYDVGMEDNKAIIKFKMINGDKHEKSVPIDSNFNMDLSKLQNDLREIIKSMKKKMDYEIEIADDFELTEADLEIPGLEFADPETALERKIRALQPSVKVDSAELATVKPKIASEKKAAPAWEPFKQARITPSIIKRQSKERAYSRRKSGKPSFRGDEKPGQLEKGKADPEQQLQALIDNKKPQMPQGQEQNKAPAQNKPAWEPRKKDPIFEECLKIKDKDACNKEKGKCYFNEKAKLCYKDLNIIKR